MHGRDLKTSLQEFRHDRIDFFFSQDEIAHHHCRVAHGLESEPPT
jgi:hypothetical protein